MRERTIEKIRAAIKELQQNNKRISVRSVAESASTSKDNARLYIKLYLSSVPDSNGVPDLESVPALNDVPDLKGVPDFMYTTHEERADAIMTYLNDSSKRVVTRDIIEMNEIVDMLFSNF
jgi:hypothetical protein